MVLEKALYVVNDAVSPVDLCVVNFVALGEQPKLMHARRVVGTEGVVGLVCQWPVPSPHLKKPFATDDLSIYYCTFSIQTTFR